MGLVDEIRGELQPGDEWTNTEAAKCPKPEGNWEAQLANEDRKWQTEWDSKKQNCVISAQPSSNKTQPAPFDQITYGPGRPNSHIQVNDYGDLEPLARPGLTNGWSWNLWEEDCPNKKYWQTHAPEDW